jgi:ectoine hydroxylase-related dioxygenase (phytanoyl-CoA dioxygenase family)
MMSAAVSKGLRAMTAREKFLFDLNGFVVVRNALSLDEVNAMNVAIDRNMDKARARDAPALKNAVSGTGLSDAGPRFDLGGMLGWPSPDGDMFRKLLCHRALTPYLIELVGDGFRLDHQPMVLIQDKGSEGFAMHGGPLSGHDGTPEGRFNPELQYRCQHGSIWNSLLAMAVFLYDAKEGDGGFAALRGSHKLNYAMFKEMTNGDDPEFWNHIYQPAVNKGDVLFFSEATVHGSIPWKADHQRRLALYRFSPANFAYGRAYLNDWKTFEDVLSKCTAHQRAVLAPPHAVRLERPTVTVEGEDGPIQVYKRSQAKKDHDAAVFGSDYF